MILPFKRFQPFAARAVIVTVAVLLAMGVQAGNVIASVLNVALETPQRPVHEEKEERGEPHRKAGAVDCRNRDRFPEPGRATASGLRLPIPTLSPRTPFPATRAWR